MNRGTRRERRRYNPVAATEGQEGSDDEGNEIAENETDENPSPSRRPGRQYSRVSNRDEDGMSHASTEYSINDETASTATDALKGDDDDEFDVDDDDDGNRITVTILDFAHSRFEIEASPSWTIDRFKKVGAKTHKVAPSRQRLIFRGKMLGEDNKSLQDYGIKEDGVIIHLFPKPRVVITNNDDASESTAQETQEVDVEEGGARVPTIVMDAAEAERRSQILVLGSTEFIEAQNNVKLFSFMLLIISSIELLNLLAIAMGVPQGDGGTAGIPVQQDDYNTPPQNDDGWLPSQNYSSQGTDENPAAELYSHWGTAQYIDTVISILGVYVALLGLKASTENTLRLARIYLIGVFVSGTAWLLFNFFFTAAIEHKVEAKREEDHQDDEYFTPLSDGDIYRQAMQVMILPGMVWLMCFMRAWQFQHLLNEAELEAEDRIQSQLHLEEDGEVQQDGGNTDQAENSAANHDEELALSNNNAVLA